MKEEPKQEEQQRSDVWSKMLAKAGTHPDPNPPSPKARSGQGWKRPPDHAFNNFKFK